MKISELKPCSVCGGPIAPLFYRVTVEQIMFDSTATNQVLGLNMMFGGNALRLAEAMAPNDDGNGYGNGYGYGDGNDDGYGTG